MQSKCNKDGLMNGIEEFIDLWNAERAKKYEHKIILESTPTRHVLGVGDAWEDENHKRCEIKPKLIWKNK